MVALWIVLGIVLGLVALALLCFVAVLLIAVYFFRFTMLRKPPSTLDNNINANTNWHQYQPVFQENREWLATKTLETVSVTSNDGLKLNGYLLKAKQPKNRVVICFHGYTGEALSNFTSISRFYYEKGVDTLMVDARAHGNSEGKYIGFGVLDRYDALQWIQFVLKRYGEDCTIYLHGVSMGGATVLMTSGFHLPKQVQGIVADCAFTSAYEVFSHILKRDYHLPKFPLMNLTNLLTQHYAGYGFADVNTREEVAHTKVPILFIHGEKDDFVPTEMSVENYRACASRKELMLVENADHAESYYAQTDSYQHMVTEFLQLEGG